MYIRKETADYNSESISCNCPRSMFTTAAGTEIFSGNQNTAFIFRIVKYKVFFNEPSLLYLQSLKRFSPNPFLSVALRKRAGIIWSVSTFSNGSGTHVLTIISNFASCFNVSNDTSRICYHSCNCCCRCNKRACQYCSRARSLTTFKISVAC